MADILIVDDEGLVRQTIQAMLEDSGHRSRLASNGREAQMLVRAHRFEIVVLDMMMPEKEGIETILDFRRDIPQTKIIAISGGGRLMNLEFLRMARAFGATEALRKPFVRDDLLRAVNRCLAVDAVVQDRPPMN